MKSTRERTVPVTFITPSSALGRISSSDFELLNNCSMNEWWVFSESYAVSVVGKCNYFVLVVSFADLEGDASGMTVLL